MIDLHAEREQLISTFRSALAGGWLSRPKACVRALAGPAKDDYGMDFRQTHNIFGWMAGNSLRNRGLCSGAIYRSERFMSLPQAERNGSAGPRRSLVHLQNIHIEHTVPIAEIKDRWSAYRSGRDVDVVEAYAWMFVHSVSTAVHMQEKGGLGSYERRTDAFDRSSPWFDRPFMRYSVLEQPPAIWNVLTGERIVPEAWSFRDHFSTVMRLLELGGCDPSTAAAMRKKGDALVPAVAGPGEIAVAA